MKKPAPSLIPVDLRTLVLGSRSIKLIWSIVLTVEPPIEQIDGFYIGYRPLVSLGGLTAAGPGSATGTNAKNNNPDGGSGSIDSSTNGIMLIGSPLEVQTGNGPGEKQQTGGQTKHSVNVITDNNGGDGAAVAIENNKGTIPYTFKTMYDDPNSKLAFLMSTAAINNNGSSLSNKSETKQVDSGNNNNMTSYCELINRNGKDLMDFIQMDSISKNKFQSNKQQWNTAGYGFQRVTGPKLTNHKLQIRCIYEFVLNVLQRQTRYGY